MNHSISILIAETSSIGIAGILFLSMLAVYWGGLILSRKRRERGAPDGLGRIESSFLGLLALLLAFTFGMASSRYDARRAVIVEEANDISTAILRSDLYANADRELFRSDFKEYVEARISYYEAGSSPERQKEASDLSSMISSKLWKRAATLAQDRANLIQSGQMIPALNKMIDVVTTRNAREVATVPTSVLLVLFTLCLLSSFALGYSQSEKRTPWVVVVVMVAMMSVANFIILDLDRPHKGFITLDATNNNIVELRRMF